MGTVGGGVRWQLLPCLACWAEAEASREGSSAEDRPIFMKADSVRLWVQAGLFWCLSGQV